jgi:hypothetical protein
MQIPKIHKEKDVKSVDYENKRVKILNDIDNAEFYCYDFMERGSLDKMVKRVERIVRKSYEYRTYIKYLKNELSMNQFTFFSNVDMDDIKGISLEMHHYPFTLYDIVSAVINQKVYENETQMTDFSIADEVMQLHYKNQVGIVPMSKTNHELAHNGELFINLNNVFGDVRSFLNKYNMGITSELNERLEKLISLSKQDNKELNTEILEKFFTEIKSTQFKKLKKTKKNKEEKTA